ELVLLIWKKTADRNCVRLWIGGVGNDGKVACRIGKLGLIVTKTGVSRCPFEKPIANQPAINIVVDSSATRLGGTNVQRLQLCAYGFVVIVRRIDSMDFPRLGDAVMFRHNKSRKRDFRIHRRKVKSSAADTSDKLAGLNRYTYRRDSAGRRQGLRGEIGC